MLTLNVTNSRINGILDGKNFNVPFDEDVYQDLLVAQSSYEDINTQEEYAEWVDEVKAILEDDDNEENIITTVCDDLMYDSKKGFYYLKTEKGTVSNIPVPQKLVNVILESVEKGINPTPVVKAWTRFLRNPNFTEHKADLFADYITALVVDEEECDTLVLDEGYSEDKAEELSTYNDVQITQEGLIVAKKYATLITEGWVIDKETNKAVKAPLFKTTKEVDQFSGEVTETTEYPDFVEELTYEPSMQGRSGDAFYCGDKKDHIIKVGEIHKLDDWSQVNCDDNQTCVKGLHVGGIRYVQSYGGGNRQLLECFVDPSEIGAICDVSPFSDGAMRVKEYFIYGAVEGRTKGIYHSSKYASKKDEEWEEMKKAAIEQSNKLVEEVNSIV
jgi:hypothetical protein